MIALAIIALVISCFAFLSAQGAKEEVARLRRQLDQLKPDVQTVTPKALQKTAKLKTAAKVNPEPNISKTPDKKPNDTLPEQIPLIKIPPPQVPTGPTFIDRAFENFSENWLIWVSALSLAFGGLFFVQYGIEHGYLGPVARVICALAFGVTLLVGAEYLRRKPKLGMQGWFSVPVALASGGIASLYAGVVSAHALYELTSALTGFASMVFVSFLALGAGLIYGPILAVVGILGAYISPLIVIGGETTPLLYLYFLTTLVTALTLERTQRWIWLSALAVTFSLAWGVLLNRDQPGEAFYPFYIAAIVIAVTSIPAFGIRPKWETPTMLGPLSLAKIGQHYPTVLAVITAMAGAFFVLTNSLNGGVLLWQTSLIIMVALLVWAIIWNVKAQNLDQFALIFGGTIALLLGTANSRLDSSLPWSQRFTTTSEIGAVFPFTALIVLFVIVLFLWAAFWRVKNSVRPLYWLACGAFSPLILLLSFYHSWSRYQWFGDTQWGWLMVLNAAVIGGCAFLMQKRKFDKNTLASDLFFLSGFILLFAATTLLVGTDYFEHTFAALAVLALITLIKYNLKWTGLAIWLHVTGATLIFSGRMLLDFRFKESLWEILLSAGVVAGLFFTGYTLAAKANKPNRLVLFETAGLFVLATTACYLIARLVPNLGSPFGHMNFGSYATVWALMAGVQLRRMISDDGLNKVRKVLTILYSALSLIMFLFAVSDSPLFGGYMRGIFPIDSVVVAYGLPTLVFAALYYFKLLHTQIKKPIVSATIAASVLFIAIHEIRRFWHGSIFNLDHGFHIGELYTYTVILLLSTISVVFLAITRKSDTLRKVGLALAAITVAKVFFWDMNGMTGLPRATAFIVLGLTMAGLGWVLQSAQFDTDKPEKT